MKVEVTFLQDSWPPQVKVKVEGVTDPRYCDAEACRTICAGFNPYLQTWTPAALAAIAKALREACGAGLLSRRFVDPR